MAKHKYQLYFLLVTLLSFATVSARAGTGTTTAGSASLAPTASTTTSEYFGSDSPGWDYDTMGPNPYAQKQGQVYDEPSTSITPFNHIPTTDYYANSPGMPAYDPQPTLLVPRQDLGLPEQFQSSRRLPNTSRRNLTPTNPKIRVGPVNGLPPTVLDSFVETSHLNDAIYGDEGTFSLFGGYPTASTFSYISQGFDKESKEGLTTGHGSRLPSAWGGDEFHQNEHSHSGPDYATSAANTTDVNNAPADHVPTN